MPTIPGTDRWNFEGAVSVDSLDITGNTKLSGSRVANQFSVRHSQKPGTAVVTESMDIYVAESASTIKDWSVRLDAMPDGGDYTVTVKLQRSVSGGAFADVTNTVTFSDSDNTARTTKTATINTASLAAGDVLRCVITAAGSATTQGQGICVQATIQADGLT